MPRKSKGPNLEVGADAVEITGVPGAGAWALLALSLLDDRSSGATGPSGGATAEPSIILPLAGVPRPENGCIVIVRKSEEDLEDIEDALSSLAPLCPEARQGLPPAFFGDDGQRRQGSLERLHRGARLVLATAESLEAPAPSRARFTRDRLELSMGDTIPMVKILERLARLRYQRVDFVESPGEFAVRGAVVDVYALEPLRAVRILFNENTIESIRAVDTESQTGGAYLDAVAITTAEVGRISSDEPSENSEAAASWRGEAPARADTTGGGAGDASRGGSVPEDAGLASRAEGAPMDAGSGDRATVRDWLSEGGLWLVEEGLSVRPPKAPMAVVGTFTNPTVDLGASPSVHFQGNLELAAKQIRGWRAQGFRILLYSINRGEDERVEELLRSQSLPGGACQFLIGPLRSGFVLPTAKLAIMTVSELFERSYRPAKSWPKYDAVSRRAFHPADLKPGDYVVHQQYGVARYRGIRPIETGGQGAVPSTQSLAEISEGLGERDSGRPQGLQDCLTLEYRNNDRVYVPMPDFRLVQKFIGAEGHRPRLSSLDTRSWEDVKERVKEGVRDLAEQLLKVEAARAAQPGHAFPPDSHMEAEFADAFPYEETPDQRRAIEEVKADMTAPHPMDRIVVGDVGFGKTEVAMRACLKCVAGMKQAAVLVPTTILADQHFRTFTQRFADYPVRVAILSRFIPAAEERKTLEGLAEGTVDVVIATHRLLSPDIRFKDLGLLVVDEEHRFGVKDKERLKALRRDVDVLTLSATPIPRTLNQALTGLRRVSLIQSAPSGRQPIVTKVGPWSEAAVAAAIQAELDRGGQAYYVYNKVRLLPEKVEALKSLLPGVKICMAHGQMRADALEKAMWDFFNRKHDVLAASTIIESGLDIPTVNTLLVENAQDFGLAQLYQLRGRIGRERQKAFCYLFYPPGLKDVADIPEEARGRLTALRELAALGSGMKLAMRDLEIRGAGDLLGAKQHGFINAVGVEYYSDLLQSEIARLKGKPKAKEPPPVQLDLPIPAYLPDDYLPGEHERLLFYKRLLAAKPSDLSALRKELEDLSGPLPEPAANLFRLMEARAAAAKAGIREAAFRGEHAEIRFRSDVVVPPRALAVWHREYAGRLEFVRDPEGDGVKIRIDGRVDSLRWLGKFLRSSAPDD